MIQAFLHVSFISSEVSICVLEKMLLEFLEQSSISTSKQSFDKNFGKLPIKHPFWSPLFEYTYRPSRREKGHSPSGAHVLFRCTKRSMSNKFQTCAKDCACDHVLHMMKLGLVIYIYSLFRSEIYVILNEKSKIYKGSIRSAMY